MTVFSSEKSFYVKSSEALEIYESEQLAEIMHLEACKASQPSSCTLLGYSKAELLECSMVN
jgi:hypothetical protein